MDITKIKEKIPTDLIEELKVVSGTVEEEQQRQDYLQGICQRLMGDELDFERYPVFFCVVDNDTPNAAFVPGKKPEIIAEDDNKLIFMSEEEKAAKIAEAAREQYPTVFVTKGLLKMAENEDQLAYILGHELGHLRQDFLLGEHINSKMEEATSDLNSLDMMARAGYDINEARKLAHHIFTNENELYSLRQIIARTLDAHPNNESRLNAIDIKIKAIEDSYQKENIDINTIEPTPVSETFEDDINGNRFVSLFERELKELGYYDSSLDQKQEILLSYMIGLYERNEFWNNDSTFNRWLKHKENLNKIVYAHIKELRKEMPARVIKQSDADFFSGYIDNTKENDEKWLEIVGKEYCEIFYDGSLHMPWHSDDRRPILNSYPFKIVPDEEYEAQLAIETEKKRRQLEKISNGTDLSLQFWDRLIMSDIYEFTDYANVAINPLNGIDLTKTETGKRAIETIKRAIDDEYFSSTAISTLTNNFQNYNEEKELWSENKSENMHIAYRGIFSAFFYRFDPQSFPSLNLEMTENPTVKKLPKKLLFSNNIDISKFGLKLENLMENVYLVQYNADYQNPYQYNKDTADWYYFVDQEGNILDSFSPKKLKDKKNELIEQTRIEFFKQLADIVKHDYAMLQEIKQNPGQTNLKRYELERLKRYTSGQYPSIKPTDDKDWRLKMYIATLSTYDPYITYSTTNLKKVLEDDYYRLLDKSPISNDYLRFDHDLILSFLTEEEKNFASEKYYVDNDEAIFNAIYDQMVKTGDYNLHMSEFRTSDYSTYEQNDWRLNHQLSWLFTNSQVIRYQKKYLEITPAEELQNSYRGDVMDMVHTELNHLYGFIEYTLNQNPEIAFKDIDFTQYQSLYSELLSNKIGIPLDLSNYTRPNKDLTSSEYIFLSYALTNHILSGKTNKLPLKEFFNDHSTPTFLHNVLIEKFEPFLLNRVNYPEDTVEAAKVYKNISKDIRKLEVVAPFMVDLIRSETDPKKALQASLIFLETLKYENTDETAALKNSLLENNIIFDKSRPLMYRIGAYQQVAAISGFADDYRIQNELLRGFINEIEAIKDPVERNSFYDIFINKDHRISDPDIRREVQRLWVESAFEACGSQIDDNSAALHQKIGAYLDKLHGSYEVEKWNEKKTVDNVSMADRIEISKLLADRFVSQQELSMMIKPKPSGYEEMNPVNKTENNMMISGFDGIKLVLEHDRDEASQLIDFLLSKGEMSTCAEYSAHLKEKTEEIRKYASWFDPNKSISPETLQVMHREFWGYPLEARAVVINDLLYSASSRGEENRWEDIFKKVAPKIFPNADSDMSKIGTEFLHSYIKSRKENERTLYLAAMMVAANENSETTDPEKSIAKGIRLFLENSGPAAIKLGQAMASYTDVPKFIRDEMQNLKSNASRPSRWEIYEWLDFYKNKDGDQSLQFDKDVWLGRIIGSASYFVTLEKGKFEDGKIPETSDRVTKILRAGAKISSDKEFKIFENMLYDLAQKGVMTNGVDSFVRLVKQAQETVEVETDLGIGYSQLETAKKLYKEKEIEADGHTFKLRVVDWPEYGRNWADLERAQGLDLDQIQDPQYKKAASKAYFTVELMNMLSGSRFDHDRHGKQLKIDPKTNTIGLFDTGAMAIVDPSEKDKELLGKVIYKTLQKTLELSSDGPAAFGKIGAILSSEIEQVYAKGETTSTYLTECQRGLLALTDFYKDLSANDFIECINSAINNKDMPIDKSIIKGFVQEGIKEVGIFESNQPLLSHKDKETLGALIFNVYASGSVHGTATIGETLKQEVLKLKDQGVNMPILNIISEKLSDTQGESIGLNIPKEFMPTVSEVVSQKDIDIAILKGVMKEAVNSVDLQGQKDNYPVADRQELGKLLYDTFDLMVEKRREGEKIDMATAFVNLQQSGQYKTELGTKIAAVIKTAQQLGSTKGMNEIDVNEIVKASLLSGNMDAEISKGISERFKEKHPNLLLRNKIAKGLNAFLTQKTEDMGLIKKGLVRLFVKKPNIIAQTATELDKQISSPSTGKKLIETINGYVNKFARIINQKPVKTQIKINDNTR